MSTAVRQPSKAAGAPGRTARFRAWFLRRAPGLIYWVAVVVGLADLFGALDRHGTYRFHAIRNTLPVPATAAATAISVVSGLLLLRLASGLRKRKRRAWRAAVFIVALITASHFVRGIRVADVIISLLLLVMLIAARSRYTAKGDPHTRWFAVKIFLQLFFVAVVYGLVMLYVYDDRVAGHPSFGLRLKDVLASMIGAGGYITIRGERFSDLYYGTLFAFGVAIVLVFAWLVLRPSEPVAVLSPLDEEKLRCLLAKQGERDSLGYFALRRDKSVVWSPTGKAAITYRVVLGVALASGDPIGDPEAWPGAIAAYQALVAENAWVPAVMGCSELGATVFKREMGLTALALGDEAIVDVADFSLDGRPMRGVRQACTRVSRCGYDVQVRRVRDIDPDELWVLRRAAERWRGDGVERGFSMALSRLGDPSDGACVLATATRNGELEGLLHFVPWGCDGLSLDLMRRNRDADNGLNEFMISSLISQCGDLGVRRVSLNFAVFRDALERGERIGAGPVLRLWWRLLLLASRWWQIESLYRFNVKFRPYWEPRFISFPSTRDVPRIAVAALEAEAFIVRPHRLKQLLGRG